MRAVLLIAFLVTADLSIRHWRNTAPISSAPVFSLPMMDEAMKNPGEFQKIIEAYQADRGAEMQLPGPDGTSLTLFYFEWDQVEAGPLIAIAGHEPEICNAAAGFTLRGLQPGREFIPSALNIPIIFDATTFTDPSDRPVHVYKAAWMEGVGSWNIRHERDRITRLLGSFKRGSGAARVIECGVMGANNEAQAWQIFQSEVLANLVFKQ